MSIKNGKNMKIVLLSLSAHDYGINYNFLNNIKEKYSNNNVEFEIINIDDVDFPIHKFGVETPSTLNMVIEKIRNADGLIVTSPEYNGTLSGFGKNILDWISTVRIDNMPALDKTFALCCCVAPATIGGIRALPDLVRVMISLGCVIVDTHATVGGYDAKTPENNNFDTIIAKIDRMVEIIK